MASIRKRYPDARAIGIGLPTLDEATSGPAALRIGAEELPVVRCRSVLALRERLVDLPAAGPPLVVLTDLPTSELGEDLRARLAHRRLFSIDAWQLVKERFKAHYVDPRLVERHKWAARALLDAEPEAGYRPAPSGFLDAETAWRGLFEGLVGIPRGERDPETLLAWALDDEPERRLAALPQAVREGLVAAAEDSAGCAAGAILVCAGRLGRRAVSVGLVARVLFGTNGKGDERAAKARGKLEALLDLLDLDADLACAWTDAAERVVRRRLSRSAEPGEPDSQGPVEAALADADDLIRTLGAEELAGRSGILRASLDQRLTDFARELTAFVGGAAQALPDTLRNVAERVLDHALAGSVAHRAVGVEMALRLAGWLAAQRGNAPVARRRFGDAVRCYGREGAFVDRARARLWDGDPSPVVAEAYAALTERADEARQQENHEFGRLLADWPGPGPQEQSLLGVEAVLDRCVAPLAGAQPVLVLVVDAMSMAVFRELEHDLAWRGWVELVAEDTRERPVVVAALPTVTEVSRTSLLCGAITSGNAAKEKDGFSRHAGTALVLDRAGNRRWWTFAGLRANAILGELAGAAGLPTSRQDNIAIRLSDRVGIEELRRRLDDLPRNVTADAFPVPAGASDALKFSSCLPEKLALRTIRQRGSDVQGARACLREPIRSIVLA